MMEFSDEDLRAMLNRALRTAGILALLAAPFFWRAWGWRSLALFLVGAVIAASGILEWRQLMSAILDRLQAGGKARSMGPVLFWFFLRLAAAAALLYVSLKSLDGRVSALIAGLALALVALFVEAIRLLRSWSA
jgi:hypothetical protein